jgi:hypothetical protein
MTTPTTTAATSPPMLPAGLEHAMHRGEVWPHPSACVDVCVARGYHLLPVAEAEVGRRAVGGAYVACEECLAVAYVLPDPLVQRAESTSAGATTGATTARAADAERHQNATSEGHR